MKQRIGKMLFILFSSGVAAGILTAFFLRGYFLDEFDIMQAGLLKSLDEKLYSRVGLFMFLFWQRTKQALFLLCMLTTSIGLSFLYVITVFAGAAGGCYLFAACCRYGISGTVVFFFGFLPQGFFYFFLIYFLILQGLGGRIVGISNGTGNGDGKKTRYGRKIFNSGRRFSSGLMKVFFGAVLLLLGCFSETCFNPPLLRWILHLVV